MSQYYCNIRTYICFRLFSDGAFTGSFNRVKNGNFIIVPHNYYKQFTVQYQVLFITQFYSLYPLFHNIYSFILWLPFDRFSRFYGQDSFVFFGPVFLLSSWYYIFLVFLFCDCLSLSALLCVVLKYFYCVYFIFHNNISLINFNINELIDNIFILLSLPDRTIYLIKCRHTLFVLQLKNNLFLT